MHVCTLRTNFYIPFYGLYLTALGICDAMYCLTRCPRTFYANHR